MDTPLTWSCGSRWAKQARSVCPCSSTRTTVHHSASRWVSTPHTRRSRSPSTGVLVIALPMSAIRDSRSSADRETLARFAFVVVLGRLTGPGCGRVYLPSSRAGDRPNGADLDVSWATKTVRPSTASWV